MPRLSVDRAELYYEIHGDGPAMVLAHGVGGNHALWFQQIPTLRKSHRLVIFDHRGFGNSTDPEHLGRSRFVEDLRQLLDHLRVDNAILVGQSMGGGTCVGFTDRYPERVAALILADSLHGIEEPEDVRQRMDDVRAMTKDWNQLERVLGETTRNTASLKCVLYSQITSFNATNRHNLTGSFDNLVSPSMLADTGVPVSFIVGEEDPLFPPDAITLMHARISGSRVVVLPRAGHSAFFEQPDQFNQALTDLLAAVRAS